MLLPSCIQNSRCKKKVANSIGECERCGGCRIAELLDLADQYGCRTAVATGGRLAMKLAGEEHIEAVVAIACEKELREGLKGVFPKPALGIINSRPNGPCKDTEVKVEEVEKAIKYLTRGAAEKA